MCQNNNKGERQSESGIAGSIISPRNHTIPVQDEYTSHARNV